MELKSNLVYAPHPMEKSPGHAGRMTWARDAYANGDIEGEITVRPSCRRNLRQGDGPPPYDAATTTGMYDRD